MRIERAECPRNGVHDKGEASQRSDVLHRVYAALRRRRGRQSLFTMTIPLRKLTLDYGGEKGATPANDGAGPEALDLELKVCQILHMQYGSREIPSPLGA